MNMAVSPAAFSDADVSDPGSIAGVSARLVLWGKRAPHGLARVEFDSDYSRQGVDAKVQAGCIEAGIPWHHLELPQFTDAAVIVSWLKEQMALLPRGVVSITGWATAFPVDVPLIDSLRVLNYNRENLAQFPLRQIWWLTRPVADLFIREIPDLNSWFIVRLSLDESIVERNAHLTLPEQSVEDQTSARRQAQDLISRFVKSVEQGEEVSVLISLARASAMTLSNYGLLQESSDVAISLLIEIENAVQSASHNISLVTTASVWEDVIGRDDPKCSDRLVDLAVLYDLSGNFTTAENLYKAAVTILFDDEGRYREVPDHAVAHLADFYVKHDQFDEAAELYKDMIPDTKQYPSPKSFAYPDRIPNLARIYIKQGKYQAAEKLLFYGLPLLDIISPFDPNVYVRRLESIANLYRILGRLGEAELFESRAEDTAINRIKMTSS